MLKSQDILVWIRVFILKEHVWTIASVASSTGLSASEVHAAIGRLALSRLYDPVQKKPIISAMEEFLVHGFKYVFPAQYQGLDRGLPTGIGGPVLSLKFSTLISELPVWACVDGTVRGQVIKPLHPQVPTIALKDAQWYAVISLLDALRSGKVREQQMAIERLRNFLHGKEDFTSEASKH
jgi:hypothetical protein